MLKLQSQSKNVDDRMTRSSAHASSHDLPLEELDIRARSAALLEKQRAVGLVVG
jgi:hypothetical protein